MEVTLCGASWYEQKYYFNPAFDKLPGAVKDELQILCVEYTEDVGGVLTIDFKEDRRPHFTVRSMEGDQRFDEIGSELKIKELQREKEQLMEKLTIFYRLVVLGEPMEKASEGIDLQAVMEKDTDEVQ